MRPSLGQADRGREPGLAGRPGGAERLYERGVGAEVEHVERGGGRLLTHERVRERFARGRLDPDLLGLLDLATLRGGDERDPSRPPRSRGGRAGRARRSRRLPGRPRKRRRRPRGRPAEREPRLRRVARAPTRAAGALARLVADVVLRGRQSVSERPRSRERRGRGRVEVESVQASLTGVRPRRKDLRLLVRVRRPTPRDAELLGVRGVAPGVRLREG